MDWEFTEEEKMIRDMVRDFAERRIAPIAAEIDEKNEFPLDVVREMGKLGILGIPVPQEYGGGGASTLAYIIAVEELSKVSGSMGITLAAHHSLGTFPIMEFGDKRQKEKYLPDLATGRKLGAFGLTEPNAGSDAGGTQTTAVRKGDHYVVNGSKIFITNATYAETAVITAVTDAKKKHHGISSFILEKGMPGFKAGKKEDKLGLRGSDTAELFFEDVKVPVENRLGEEGEGFIQFMKTLDGGRISIGALALGLAEGAFDVALKYSVERKQFGVPLWEHQMIQYKLANMATNIEAAKHLVYHAAIMKDKKIPYSKESAMCKLFASEIATQVCRDAIQILGANGYSREFPVERMLRDVKLCEIGEGTSEIQRIVITRNLIKSLQKT
ncbi:MAG: acyl-CoA dehydrogenase [Planctomycetota bacterium]|nr:acyl-CoA dehydrogenase [Planctomycetota bacterium]